MTLSALWQVFGSHQNSNQNTCFSSLTVNIAARMPELYAEGYLQTANVLLTGSRNEKVSEYFRLMAYIMSNGLFPRERDPWNELAHIIGNIIANSGVDLRRFRGQSFTMRAFLDRLFSQEIILATEPRYSPGRGAFIPERPLGIIEMLLNSGQDPDKAVGQWAGSMSDFTTPIGRALAAGHVELVRLLLRSNVRVDNMQAGPDRYHVIQVVLNGRFPKALQLRLLELLHRYQAISPDEVLCGALQLCDRSFALELLQGDVDVTKRHREWPLDAGTCSIRPINNCLEFETPFTRCLGGDGSLTMLLLNHPSVTKHPSYLTSAETFIVTAIRGSCDIMEYLLALRPSGLTCEWNGITPFQAAVAYNNISITQLFLERSTAITTDLILIASWCGHEDILCLLLQHAVSADILVSWSDLVCLTQFGYTGSLSTCRRPIARLLVENKAMDTSQIRCLAILFESGARMEDVRISTLAKFRSTELLVAALSAGGDPNDRDESNQTAIQWCLFAEKRTTKPAVLEGQEETHRIVQVLLDFGAELFGGEVVKSIRDSDNNLTMLLLQNGGTLMDLDHQGTSCLEAVIMSIDDHIADETDEACERDFLKDLVMAQDCAIDAGPFCAAIQRQDWDLVDRLLERPHKETNCHLLEGTAIGLAARSGQLSVLDNLLSRFYHPSVLQSGKIPFVNESGELPMPYSNAHFEQARWKSSINPTRDFWRIPFAGTGSPLTLAALGEGMSGFEELLRRGCCPDTSTMAVIAAKNRSATYLSLLEHYDKQFGTSPSLPKEQLPSSFRLAIERGDSELLRSLVEAGANVNDFDVTIHYGRSALQSAVELGHSSVVHYLLERGASVNAPPVINGGATALQFAAIGGYIGYAKLLLDRGARINARGSRYHGRTALEGAAEHGRLDMLEFLLQSGAAWSGRGRHQFVSAVRFATDRRHYACVDWLKDGYGWTEEDEDIFKHCVDGPRRWDAQYSNCNMFCCDEIHGSETECIHYYDADIEERIKRGEFILWN